MFFIIRNEREYCNNKLFCIAITYINPYYTKPFYDKFGIESENEHLPRGLLTVKLLKEFLCFFIIIIEKVITFFCER